MSEAPSPSGRGGALLLLGHSADLGQRVAVGGSLAVAGVCLTVTERRGERSVVEAGPETLSRTTLGSLRAGDEVNLEPPLRVGDPLGGHWVQGHVDAAVEVSDRSDRGEHRFLSLAVPGTLAPYVVEKGSVALDGVSLTVAARGPERFSVALIPHTLEVTTLGRLEPGDRVNLEVDILAKYMLQALDERGRWLEPGRSR